MLSMTRRFLPFFIRGSGKLEMLEDIAGRLIHSIVVIGHRIHLFCCYMFDEKG